MVKTPVTFVVGAGASKPYGLPLGAELLRRASHLDPRHPVYQLLRLTTGISVGVINDTISDLKTFPEYSLDAFIQKRGGTPAVQIARVMIALLMAQSILEPKATTPGHEDDWLGYVIREMAANTRDIDQFFDANKVRFVTFNFDSVIERRFSKALDQLFPGRPQERLKECVPVTHVHGQLPDIPRSAMTLGPLEEVSQEWIDWMSLAADRVRVIIDEIDQETLDEAKAALMSSKVICFLGFAYHETNLAQLRVSEVLSDPRAHRRVVGSAMGLRPGEVARMRNRLGGDAILGGETDGCLTILRDLEVFVD